MKTKTLKKPTSVKEVLHYLSEIPNLHKGGCAISAIAIKRWLKKNKNIEASIVYRCNGYDFFQNKKALQGLDNPTSCSHAFIKIKNVCFDAEDTEIFQDSSCLIMPEKVVIESLNDIDSWNNDFDRNYIYDIEHNLEIDLSDIER